MSPDEFYNPFDFQPTKTNPSAGARASAMDAEEAILGDYYRRVMKRNIFPKTELDAETDLKTEEEKAEEAGKEFVTKPDSMMPPDPRPDPMENLILASATAPPDEEERDQIDPFGLRLVTTTPSFPTVKPFKVKQLKPSRKIGRIRHSLKVKKPSKRSMASTEPAKKQAVRKPGPPRKRK